MNDCILSKEDILCMQYAGMKPSRIMSSKQSVVLIECPKHSGCINFHGLNPVAAK